MPAGPGYQGRQGGSGKVPESMNSDSGAYAYSSRRMGPASTPNIQSTNANHGGPKRAAEVKGGDGGGGNGGGGGDY